MTRERDRIQENANKYIVKNCPSILPMTRLCDSESIFNCGTYCKDCTNCVIKQVIEKCKGAVSNYSNLEILRTACETSEAYGKANIAEQILQLFDIEEIGK